MDDRLVPILGVVALFALVIGAFVLTRIMSGRRSAADAEAKRERDKHVQEGIDQGVLARDPVTGEVYSRCAVCGEKAVSFAPISGVSWMDNLPLLNRLHSLAPRYVIVDNEDAGLQLCKIHKQVATKKLEEFHALLRAERAKFNSAQEDKVAQMDGGALTRALQEHHRDSLASFAPPEPVRQLPPAKDSSPMTIVTSSSSKADVEEGEDVA